MRRVPSVLVFFVRVVIVPVVQTVSNVPCRGGRHSLRSRSLTACLSCAD